jgi:MFS family permease
VPGSGVAVGALFVALWLPAALLAGPAGLLADRVSPRRVLALTAVVAAAALRVRWAPHPAATGFAR